VKEEFAEELMILIDKHSVSIIEDEGTAGFVGPDNEWVLGMYELLIRKEHHDARNV
jgi:hypothetical protein